MARTGMADLLLQLRPMVDDGGTVVWTDDQLQTIMDRHKLRIEREQMEGEKTLTSDTTSEYKRFYSRWTTYEAGGSATFKVEDSSGLLKGSADYTADYVRGDLIMDNDQGGTVLYLSAWTYDLPGAAADCWRERMGKVSSYYDFSADGQRLSRSQWFKHCQAMAVVFDMQARPRTQRQWTHGVFDDC